ncbi:hypothetical protein [Microbacterium sp.]|uniref:hypothetical protein n=1 Tax=Microbacterium sp. TaxID=51671 RepID=UPI0025DE43A7|nr:hypothetical protein [Microbacterium sp.]
MTDTDERPPRPRGRDRGHAHAVARTVEAPQRISLPGGSRSGPALQGLRSFDLVAGRIGDTRVSAASV